MATRMQLSQTAEYALRAAVWLAEHSSDPQTAQQIAQGCQMPASYLAKVLQPMTRVGIVSAQRGIGGGYLLEKPADQLTLIEIINAVEPVQRIRGCPLKLSAHAGHLCALHQALDDTMAAVEKALANQTVGQLLKRNLDLRPLCDPLSNNAVP